MADAPKEVWVDPSHRMWTTTQHDASCQRYIRADLAQPQAQPSGVRREPTRAMRKAGTANMGLMLSDDEARIAAIWRAMWDAARAPDSAQPERGERKKPTIAELEAMLSAPDGTYQINILPDGSIEAVTERDAVIEECAKVCESQAVKAGNTFGEGLNAGAYSGARAIRALKRDPK
jgi:hypothetical protein